MDWRTKRKLKKKEAKLKELSFLLAHALTGTEESILYKEITVRGARKFREELYALMKNEEIFGYYYQEERKMDTKPDVVIFKIMLNFFTALLNNTTPFLMKFWAKEDGIKVLMAVYPLLHEKGMGEKRLNVEFFDEYFSKLDIAYLTKVLENGEEPLVIQKHLEQKVVA